MLCAVERGFSCKPEGLSNFSVAQSVKNLPAMQETWAQFLGEKDPLKKGMTSHASILS